MTLNISGVPCAQHQPMPDLLTKAWQEGEHQKRNGEMLALKNAKLELDTVSLFPQT